MEGIYTYTWRSFLFHAAIGGLVMFFCLALLWMTFLLFGMVGIYIICGTVGLSPILALLGASIMDEFGHYRG